MIKINDTDLPINVANKIISGVKKSDAQAFSKALVQAATGVEPDEQVIDMFSVDEIKEIADYLMVYCDAHKNGD